MEVSGNLRDLYNDKDELRKAISGPNEFAEFYNRLKQIKEFHRKHPNEVRPPNLVSLDLAVNKRERCKGNGAMPCRCHSKKERATSLHVK